MKRILLLAAAATALFAVPASANVIYTLSNVTMSDGNQLTGNFTVTDDLSTIVDLNISAPAGTLSGFNFVPVNYTMADVVTFQLPLNSWINVTKPGHELRLSFGALTASGATLTTNGTSYDWYVNAGPRTVTGGSFIVAAAPTPAPEPASIALLAAGTGLVGFALRRKKHAAKSPA